MANESQLKLMIPASEELRSVNLFLQGAGSKEFQTEFALSPRAAAARMRLISRRILDTFRMPEEILDAIRHPRKKSAVPRGYYDTINIYYSKQSINVAKMYELYEFHKACENVHCAVVENLYTDPLDDLKNMISGKLTDFQWSYVRPNLGVRQLRRLDARNVTDQIYALVKSGEVKSSNDLYQHEISSNSFVRALEPNGRLKRLLKRLGEIPDEPHNYSVIKDGFVRICDLETRICSYS